MEAERTKMEDWTSNLGMNDELCWNMFRADMYRTWEDTSQKVDALTKLQNLCMVNEDLEDYLSRFNTVVTEGGWDRKHPGTVRVFKDGLSLMS